VLLIVGFEHASRQNAPPIFVGSLPLAFRTDSPVCFLAGLLEFSGFVSAAFNTCFCLFQFFVSGPFADSTFDAFELDVRKRHSCLNFFAAQTLFSFSDCKQA